MSPRGMLNQRALIAAGIVVLLMAFFVLVYNPPEVEEAGQQLPWQIEKTAGSIRVFGVTLGESTLGQAASRVGEEPEVSLFISPSGTKGVEAYFDMVRLGGLSAKMVLNLAVPQPLLDGMYERGLRISTLRDGTRKVDLRPEDRAQLMEFPVAVLTYIPAVNLDEELLRGRFGEPAERIRETETGIEHWLYPALGLDVALHPKEKDVLQYLPPARFSEAVRPLESGGELLPR